MEDQIQQLQQLPKADVHNHLHLSGGFMLLKDKFPQIDYRIPEYYDGFDGMMRFIQRHINPLMKTADDVVMLMDTAICSAIEDEVKLLEASVDLQLLKYFDDSVEEFLRAIRGLKHKYRDRLELKPEIGIKKDSPMDIVYQKGDVCIRSDVFEGIDLYGKETGKDLGGFRDIFDQARTLSKKTKVHIGEFSDHRSIERAIIALEPDEIQHGIRAVDSENTIEMIKSRGIRLNICPQSNIALGAVNDYSTHPLRKLYEAGVHITINTDDLLLFGATITDQFAELIKQGFFTFEEIDGIRRNAFKEN